MKKSNEKDIFYGTCAFSLVLIFKVSQKSYFHTAVEYGHLDILKYYHENSEVNIFGKTNSNGRTLLHIGKFSSLNSYKLPYLFEF